MRTGRTAGRRDARTLAMKLFPSRIVQPAADSRRPDATAAPKAATPTTIFPPATRPTAPRGPGGATVESWLAGLPEKVRPMRLVQDFPRLADKLVLADGDPELAMAVLDRLMIDDRGGRQGFPMDVASELMRLRAHYGELGERRGTGTALDWGRDVQGPRRR